MKNEIFQYFRKGNKNRRPIGVFFAAIPEHNPDKFSVGFSLCNTRKDKFDVQLGHYLAAERALTPRKRKIPASMAVEFTKFFERTRKYFKDKTFNGTASYKGGLITELDCTPQ